jgi:flavin reductase (DIM6/NTAB) family NADH-FMN oxidoreductase RutF
MFMILTKNDIEAMGRIERLNLVNSLTGPKPANLIGTIDREGNPNLAIFNSVVHIGSHPALMGFILRPAGDVRRHTHENIRATGVFTINSVGVEVIAGAHYSSAKFDAEVNEFTECGFTEEYLPDFPAPFVAESRLKIGLAFDSELPIPSNGTSLIIGRIEHVMMDDSLFAPDGKLDFESYDAAAVSGLNTYYSVTKKAVFPFAHPGKFPETLNEKKV